MTTYFIYDRSFEGLLTSVFDAYYRKVFPDALAGEGKPLPLFAEVVHTVTTDRTKASRVWDGLCRKLRTRSRNMVMHGWLSAEEGADKLVFDFICKVFDEKLPADLDFADPLVFRMHATAKRVSHEGHYIKQFLRFQKGADGTFFAPVNPVNNALPLIIDHARDRFADQKWMIYDMGRNYGFYYDMESVREIVLDDHDFLTGGRLDSKFIAEDEKLYQDLWKTFFRSLSIKERKNPRLQRQHMPRRYWKYLTEKQ